MPNIRSREVFGLGGLGIIVLVFIILACIYLIRHL